MKGKIEDDDLLKKRGPDKNTPIQSVNNDQNSENKDKKQEGAQAKKKFVDRVRRGYPDGPGGSYDGF